MVLFFFWIKLPNYKYFAILESLISISVLYFVTTLAGKLMQEKCPENIESLMNALWPLWPVN